MLTKSSIKLIELFFEKYDFIKIKKVELGRVELDFNPDKTDIEKIIKLFESLDFKVIKHPDTILVEQIKIAAFELIYLANNVNSLIRNSEYISERVQEPYSKISKIFSAETGTTLEKYLILLKIERVKELILQDDFTLSEIAYMMGYSSVQYLSNQFKKITGYTVSQFKELKNPPRIPLDKIL